MLALAGATTLLSLSRELTSRTRLQTMLLASSVPIICAIGAAFGMQNLAAVMCFFPQAIALALALGFTLQPREEQLKEDGQDTDCKRWEETGRAREGRRADTRLEGRNGGFEIAAQGRPAYCLHQVRSFTHGLR